MTRSTRSATANSVVLASRGRVVFAASIAGVLWVVSGGVLQALRWFSPLGSLPAVVLPETMPGATWLWPGVWGFAAVALGALAVAAVVAAFCMVVERSRRTNAVGRLGVWLAVIIAAVIVGLVTDLARLIALPPGMGLRGALSVVGLGTFAAAGVYWGVLYGWIAALVMGRRAAPDAAGDVPGVASAGAVVPTRRVAPTAIVLTLAVVLVTGYAAVSVLGARVHHDVQQAEALAAADAAAAEAGTPRTGAAPDATAEGDPVPETAAINAHRDATSCTRDALTLMLGNPDAATGHRVLPLRVVNISEAPCVVEGYPDVAFGDQNGHLLDVEIEEGGSFMAQDQGVVPITLQPGEAAVTYLGWNANSTHGALVAAEVHAAPVAGDSRDVWPQEVALDITEGSKVAVTAWAANPLP